MGSDLVQQLKGEETSEEDKLDVATPFKVRFLVEARFL